MSPEWRNSLKEEDIINEVVKEVKPKFILTNSNLNNS